MSSRKGDDGEGCRALKLNGEGRISGEGGILSSGVVQRMV